MTQEDLAQRVDELEGVVRALTGALKADREANADAFEELESAIAQALGEGGAEPITPVAWIDYASRGEWVELADWVDWVIEVYEVKDQETIRACWPAHLGVAEELAALWKAWREAARKAMNKDNDALAFWHDRYLAPTLHRLPGLYRINGCKMSHQEAKTSPLTDRGRLPGTADEVSPAASVAAERDA